MRDGNELRLRELAEAEAGFTDLVPATENEDKKEGTDCHATYRGTRVRVALRNRPLEGKYAPSHYMRDISLRWASGTSDFPVEADKIRAGKGHADVCFYVFDLSPGVVLPKWLVYDVHRFRELAFVDGVVRPSEFKQNDPPPRDDGNTFALFNLMDLVAPKVGLDPATAEHRQSPVIEWSPRHASIEAAAKHSAAWRFNHAECLDCDTLQRVAGGHYNLGNY